MTFDLGVWRSSPGLPATSASFIYSALCEGKHDSRLLPAAEAVSAFFQELVATWPDIPAAPAGKSGKRPPTLDSPWAAPLLRASDYVLLSCSFEHAEIALAYITALAGRHGLLVFDPQSDDIYPPDAPTDDLGPQPPDHAD